MKHTAGHKRSLKAIMNKNQTSKLLKKFCDSTSLHGYGYLYNSDSIFVKIIWVFVILAMTALGILFLANHTKEFLDSRILTTIETSSAPLSVSRSQTRYVLL